MPVPVIATSVSRASSSSVMRAPATPAFYFDFYPDRDGSWFVDDVGLDGPTWLPQLTDTKVVPGVSNFRQVKDADDAAIAARSTTAVQTAGGKRLPWDIQVAGQTGYMAHIDVIDPTTKQAGKRYFPFWSPPRTPRPGKTPKPEFDRAARNRWLHALVVEGHIAPPMDETISAEINRIRSATSRHASEVDADKSGASVAVKREADRLEAYEKAVIPSKPEPKPRSRRKS